MGPFPSRPASLREFPPVRCPTEVTKSTFAGNFSGVEHPRAPALRRGREIVVASRACHANLGCSRSVPIWLRVDIAVHVDLAKPRKAMSTNPL
jgi:hypothetical protein